MSLPSWADGGPRAGYFPFHVGLLLLGSKKLRYPLAPLVLALLAWPSVGKLRAALRRAE